MNRPDLSIVIPAFNEEHRLGPTLSRVNAFLEGTGQSFEILVVDDGSTDGTRALCERYASRVPSLRVVPSIRNEGKGHAVRLGMLQARGAYRVLYDADGATPIEELPKLIEPLRNGEASIAIGSRYSGGAAPHGQPLWRRLWSRIGNAYVQRALVPGVQDTQCGFKAFTARAAEALFARATVNGWAFDLEILALARRQGYGLVEVPVAWRDDRRTRVQPWRDLLNVLAETWRIQQRLALAH